MALPEFLADGYLPAGLMTQYPEELFPAYDADDWQEWVETFSRIRESVEHWKGIVEVRL